MAGANNQQLYKAEATQMRTSLYQWVPVKSFEKEQSSAAYSLARRIRYGDLKSFQPAGSYEAYVKLIDGLYTVWARYIGIR